MRFSVTSVDYAPDDLYEQTPFSATVLRQIPGSDRPDYFLAQLDRPLKWKTEKEESSVTHIVVTPRWVGGALSSAMRTTPVNIAYVTDLSVLQDAKLDFKKCHYSAIGTADGIG
jgi:hypothetical protein